MEAFSRELISESTKRELETKQLNEKLVNVSEKLDNLSKDNIKHESSLNNIQHSLEKIENQTSILKDGVNTQSGENKVKGQIWTVIITFIITVLAGIVVYFVTVG